MDPTEGIVPSDGGSQTARILVVDDDDSSVELLTRALAAGGYPNVRGTTDPLQTAQLFTEFEPDLLVLDLRMPIMDGFDVMRELSRELPGQADVPILILTADDTATAKRDALAAGAKDFLTKPIDRPEVVARVRNLLEIRRLRLRLDMQEQALRLLRELAESSTPYPAPPASTST